MKRISSVKHHNRIDRQISDVASKIIYTLPMILFKCILGTLDIILLTVCYVHVHVSI